MVGKVWTVEIQIDREVLEQLGPNSVPQKDFTEQEIAEMEIMAQELADAYSKKFGYVRIQHEVMKDNG